eukprot:scaffold334274_cov18-Prasinocladus_malaysianus.AAC.1
MLYNRFDIVREHNGFAPMCYRSLQSGSSAVGYLSKLINKATGDFRRQQSAAVYLLHRYNPTMAAVYLLHRYNPTEIGAAAFPQSVR